MHDQVHHIHLASHDAMAAGRFYQTMFGARIEAAKGANGIPRCTMHLGDQTILNSTVTAEIVRKANVPHTCFGFDHIGSRVAAVNNAVSELEAQGATITIRPRTDGPVTISFVQVPDGVSVELVSYLQRIASEHQHARFAHYNNRSFATSSVALNPRG